jgi:hypothetical protein
MPRCALLPQPLAGASQLTAFQPVAPVPAPFPTHLTPSFLQSYLPHYLLSSCGIDDGTARLDVLNSSVFFSLGHVARTLPSQVAADLGIHGTPEPLGHSVVIDLKHTQRWDSLSAGPLSIAWVLTRRLQACSRADVIVVHGSAFRIHGRQQPIQIIFWNQ